MSTLIDPTQIRGILRIGFGFNFGNPGLCVGPIMIAPFAGNLTKCKIAVRSSDPTIDLQFKIKKNGTDVFSVDPVISHATPGNTLITYAALISSPLPVVQDDLFTIDVITGSIFWSCTTQLE